MRWANVINALVGIWFIIAPFILKYDDMRYAMYASIVGGALLLVLAGWAAFSEEARRQRWIQYVNGLAGIGLIALPFALNLTARPHVTWTSAVGGVIAGAEHLPAGEGAAQRGSRLILRAAFPAPVLIAATPVALPRYS